jgi:septum formation protein
MISLESPLLLGSGSPRRKDLLSGLGIPLRVAIPPAFVDEAHREGEVPDRYLERVVGAKLKAVADAAPASAWAALLVADTIVVHDGIILGKPTSVRHAAAMLSRLSGTQHEVSTRFAIARPGSPLIPIFLRTVCTRVCFRQLRPIDIEQYVRSGEGDDKAGAYGIQGAGAFLVERIDGSYSNVVGLPLCQVVLALQDEGLLGPVPMLERCSEPR